MHHSGILLIGSPILWGKKGKKICLYLSALLLALNASAAETNVAVLVQHAPGLNGSGRITGSIQQSTGESATLNSGLVVTGDLLVPGSPTVVNNGNNTFAGVVIGTGSASPGGYSVILNGGVSLRYLRTRTTPVTLPSVTSPPAPSGTRSVVIDNANQNPGDFSTLRNLTLQGSAGLMAVPPGTYGNFTANSGTGFILGVAGGGQPAIYNLQNFTLNGSTTLKIVGPVILTIAHGFNANGSLGSSNNPAWFQLQVANGSFTLNSGCSVYGSVLAPNGTVTVNGNSTLVGTSTSDRFILNAGGIVQWAGPSSQPQSQQPQATPQYVTLAENSSAAITLTGSDPQNLPLTFAIATAPAHGALSGTLPNVIYRPVTNYFGGDSFTFKANNGVTDSVPAVVSLTVTQVFYPPVAFSQSLTNVKNTSLPITLAGSDPQGLPLTYAVLTQPGHGTLTGTTPNVTYHPATNYYGNDSFTFSVNNGITNSAAAIIAITNLPVDEPPMLEAGADQLVILPTNYVHLSASVEYADFPGSVDTVEWSQVGGPGSVTFSDPSNETTTATFSTNGIYRLQLYASDSFMEASDELIVTVDAPPTVFAGITQTNTFPTGAQLSGFITDDGLPTTSTLTTGWSLASGPGTVVFGDPDQTNTTATFSVSGVYVLRLTASDGVATRFSDMSVIENLPPVVNAGPDILTNGLQAALNGSVADDGLPGGFLEMRWMQASGPGVVAFSNALATNTTITASQSGTYVIQLLADDGVATNSSEVTVTFNLPPVVNAGPMQTVNFGDTVTLAGKVSDDQLPHNVLTNAWMQISGAGHATFADASLTNSTVTFDQPGIYTLRLIAGDGLATTASNVEVDVNEAPTVDAGTNQFVTQGQSMTLNGSVTDDGLPVGGTLSAEWTLVSGPGQVMFGSPDEPVTTVAFSGPGTYVFRLSASDTLATNSAETTVTVAPANHAPLVTIQPKQLVMLPGSVTLHASVADDGLPTGAILTFTWSKSSGPGSVTFADPTSTNTSVSFSQAGDYVLRLTASDSELSGFAETLVAVRTPAMNEAPVVSAGSDKVVGLTNVVVLDGAFTDDGLPLGSSVTVAWSKVSGPGNVSFVNSSITNAQATFSAEGQYELRLTASDSEKSASADVQVSVHLSNQPPTADAGEDQTVTIPNPARLLPSGQALEAGVELSTSISAAPRWNNAVGQPGLSQSISEHALSFANGKLYAGSAGSDGFVLNSTNNIGVVARWNGTNWDGLFSPVPAFSNGPAFGYMTIPYSDAAGAELIAQGDQVFVQGGFLRDLGNDGFNDWTARWDGSAWREWQVQTLDSILTFGQFTAHSNSIYLASSASFQPTNSGAGNPSLPVYNSLVGWNGSNWFGVYSNFNAQLSAAAFGPDNKLYVGGFFYLSTPTGIATNIAVWDGTNWAPMAEGVFRQSVNVFGEPIDGTSVRAIVADDVGNIYVGGNIGQAGNVPVNNIARWDGHHWFALGDGSQNGALGSVFAMVAHGHDLYVGGQFNTAGGQATRSVARWDGTVWWPLGSGSTNGANFRVWSLAEATNGIYLGGDFTEAGGVPANHVAFWEFPQEPLKGVVLNGHVSDDGLPNGQLSAQWQKISGPGTATFANPTSAVTTVTFDLPGTYVLRLTADDSALTALDEATITVHANEPPVVNAGVDATVSIGNNLVLAGAVTDDGLPDGSTLATVWKQYSGPGTATFQNVADPKTSVSFDHAGTYVLTLFANDSQFTVSDRVIVTVLPPNAAPSVQAQAQVVNRFGIFWGTSGQTGIPKPLQLGGEISDDGLPSGTLVTNWSQVSGPAPVIFANTADEFTQSVFSEPGDYVLRLTVSDSELSSSSDIPIHVFPAPSGPVQPQLWAGNDQHITLPAAALLHGYVFTTNSGATTDWQVIAGPGTVTFGDVNSPVTTANFIEPGTYVLQLSASMDSLTTSDQMIVIVDPVSGVNRAPQVTAGGPKTGVVNSSLPLNGNVTDDGLPAGSTLTSQWSLVSGPGTAIFANSSAPQTTVTCNAPGDYLFQLAASDSEFSSSNIINVHIASCEPDNLPPSVDAGADQLVMHDGSVVDSLFGSASDDNRPNGQLNLSWEQEAGPDFAEFFDASRPDTSVSLPVPGIYIFRLTASDGALSDSDEVVLNWQVPTNAPSLVDAGPWQTVLLPANSVTLHGVVPPENFPTGGSVSFHWEVEQAPGEVVFDDTNSLTPVVTFVDPPIDYSFGTIANYRFLLVASNADFSSSSEVWISVGDPGLGHENIQVDAGSDQTVTLDQPAILESGFDVSPDFSEWVVVGGPGGAVFITSGGGGGSSISSSIVSSFQTLSDFSSHETKVFFSTPGTYHLRLHAFSSFIGNGSGDVTVTVLPPDSSAPVLVSAGPPRTLVDAPANLNLAGFVSSIGAVTSSWQIVSAPDGATVTFAHPQCTNTLATFSALGDYVLQLDAGNSNSTASSQTTVSVIEPACITNQPPVVDAGADAVTTLPNPYSLNGSVSDDGFPQTGASQLWSVVSGPVSADQPGLGVTFDSTSQLNTRIFFTYPGTYVVRLTATDGSLTNSDDLVIIALPATNQPPHAFAGLNQVVNIGAPAQLAGVVWDDGIPLSATPSANWSLQDGPADVTFSDSHATNTTVTFTTLGTYVLRLTADDSLSSASSDVTITVTTSANGNQPPQVNVGAPISAVTFHALNLPGTVVDDGLPVGAPLSTIWSEVNGPAQVRFGNALQPNSPVTFLSAGTYTLRLTASDSQFGTSTELVVTVTDPTNEPPLAFAGPNLTVTRPQPALLDGLVLDDNLPVGSPLTYQWSKVSGPGTVTFVSDGGTNTDSTAWLDGDTFDAVAFATFNANGTYVLRLSASDTQYTNTDDITVIALPGTNTPPQVNAGPDQIVSLPNSAILHTEATDDGLENGTLKITWTVVSGPGSVAFSTVNGVYHATCTTPGDYVLRLTADDGALTASDDVNIKVYDTPAPVAQINWPLDGDTITSPTNIIGTASSDILQTYVIEYRLAPAPSDTAQGDSETNWATFAVGSSSVASNALAVFDPTLLLNGLYQLRLTVFDTAGRSSSTGPVSVIVDRNLKIGQFTISFNDLTVPVPGVPVQVTRTYDSRAAAAGVQGDFGLGWTLDLHNVRLQKNRLLSTGWQEYTTGDPFALSLAYHLDGGSPRIVTITFPDGRVEKFQFLPNPMDQPLAPIEYPQWRFVPIGNTQGTLVPAGYDDSDGSFLAFTGSIPGEGELYDLNFFTDWLSDETSTVAELNRYPTLFRYSSPEGYQYLIDEIEGLKSVTDPNGNTLVINTNGFTWSNPAASTNTLSIAFQRDAAGRITNIVDAAGNAISYNYDANGNLITFTDRVGQTNGFAYTNSTFIHYLTGIIDGRGTNVLQNHFDASGKIVATTDAIGNSTYFGYDAVNFRETTTNRLGYVTINDYDKLGRVIHKVDAVGLETGYTYDDFDNLLSISNGACSCATHYTYDSDNNLTSLTDELGRTIHYTYTSLRKVLTYTDVDGNSTTNSYDDRGNLLSTRDALGNLTSFTYNEQGKVTTMIDPRGGVASFEYDAAGRLINETNALGNFVHYTADANGNLTSTTRRRSLDFTAPLAALSAGNKDGKLCDATNSTNFRFIVPTYTYDNGGHLVAIVLPDGVTVCSNSFDANGHVKDSLDQAGQHTLTEYNGLGKPSRITYPDGTSESMGYDAEGQLVGHDDRGNRHTQFDYDPDGRLTHVTYHDGRSVSAVYDLRGQLIQEIDSCHGTNSYGYDAVGNRVTSTDPEGHTTVYTYNDKRACTSVTDPLGHTTTMEYDALNRNTRVIYANGKAKSSTYFGRTVTTITDEDGKISSFGYDAIGQLISTTNATGDVMRYQYDEMGNLVMSTDPNLETTSHEYDDLGRRVRTTLPDGSAQQFGYDPLGRLTASVDAAGNTTLYAYDARNNVVGITNALGEITRFTYNTLGQRLSRQDPDGRTTQWHYDTDGRLSNTTYPDGSSTATEYDGCSRISTIVDAAGGRTSYAYNLLDQVTSTTDPLTRTTAFGYDAAGNLTTQQDPAGQITQFLYDSLNRKTGIVLPDGTVVGQAYDPRGRLAAATNQLGDITQYAYDDNGRLSKTIDPLNHATSYNYDSRGNLTGVTDPLGHSTTYVYDQNNRLAQTVYADGSSAITTYDSRGLAVSRTDQLGHQTLYGYDNLGRLTSVTNALGYVTSYNYDLVGRLSSATDANGHTTTYQYDAVDNLTNTLYADGSSTSTTYDAARRPIADRDERGNITHYGYNVIGQLVSTTNALGEATTFGYDNLGRQTQAVDALGRTTHFEYDPVGHLVHTLYPDGTATTNLFDAAGRRIATVDEAGVTNRFGYDAVGQLTSVTNALGAVTTYNYDAAGRLVSQTDANNHTTTYDYDVINRRTQRTLPGHGWESFAYDAVGNLTNRVDFNGRNCAYQYDALNRPVRKLGDPFFGEPPVTWTYDRVGLRTNMTDASGATAYKYDSRYRLTQKSRTWSDGDVNATLAYHYDPAGNLTNITSSSFNGVTLGYGYDSLNRLAAVQDVFNGTTAYAYDHAGNISVLTRPNGLQTVYNYDARDRATNITTIDASMAVLSRYLYSYGSSGNRVGATETVVTGGLTNSLGRTYSYDPTYRLTNEIVTGPLVAGTAGYTYDAVGNRLARASTLPGLLNQTFTYTADDQLTSDSYDANGNTIAATVPDPYTGTPVAATDTYDHADRLIRRSTTLNSQSATIAYQYDGDGNRVGKTVGGVTTHFVVDEANPTGWPQVLEELSAPSSQLSTLAVARVYSYGYGPLSQDQLAGSSWNSSQFGHDAHGNVRYLTDGSGHVTDTFDYDAFGSVIQRSGSTPTTRLFTGEEQDPELGLYNLRARYHNPGTGRFWTRDSFEGYTGNPASQHGYTYALNNPLNMLDPSGHEGLGELAAVGAIAPDVDRSVSSIWSGIFHYLSGIGGGGQAGTNGQALLAANGQEAMFIQGLSQHAGINIGRDNFFATMQGAPFLLAPNPFVFASDNPCFQYEVLHFDSGAPIWGPANRNPVFPEWRSQLLDDLIDVGHGSFVGADLRRWAAQQAALGSQGSGTEGLWANFGYNVRAELANAGAGLISPTSWKEGVEHLQERAEMRESQELLKGHGDAYSEYIGWSSIAGDLIGINNVLEGSFGSDLATGEKLNAEERWRRGPTGVSQIAGTVGVPLAGSIDAQLAKVKAVRALNSARQAVQEQEAVIAQQTAQDSSAAANASQNATSTPKPCVAQKPSYLPHRKGVNYSFDTFDESLGISEIPTIQESYETYLNRLASENPILDAQRRVAIEEAWHQEQQLALTESGTTRAWTPAQLEELKLTGRVSGYEGHHINSALEYPELAGNPDNIQFVTRQEHFGLHNENWRNPTQGPLVSRTPWAPK